MQEMIYIKRALISVYDKTGIIPFVKSLLTLIPDLQIIATSGTSQALLEADIITTPLSQYTCFPQCFEGQIRALHPNITGGILFRRGIDDAQAKELGIEPIDLVVCNVKKLQGTKEDLIESMDIGGTTLIKSASKNYKSVAVVTNPREYLRVLQELKDSSGALSYQIRENLASQAIHESLLYEKKLAKAFEKDFFSIPVA